MIKKYLLAAAIALAGTTAFAIPAKPDPIRITQPDGTEILVTLRGDERHHVYLSEDGRILAREGDAFYYALVDEQGLVTPSRHLAHSPEERTATETAFLAARNHEADVQRLESARTAIMEQRAALRATHGRTPVVDGKKRTPGVGLFENVTFPGTGDRKVLVILAQYTDRKFFVENPNEYFTNMLNEPGFSGYGATGSARDYFMDSSMGQFRPQFDVYGPVDLPEKMSYYGGNEGLTTDPNAYKMLIHACEGLDETVDFSQYDEDGDGYIDNVYLFYAGLSEAHGAASNTVWPHAWNITLAEPGRKYVFDGVILDHYATSQEWEGSATQGKPDGIGTIIHEFSHVMGLPDLYSVSYNSQAWTPNRYDVMDSGPYNNESRTPPYYSAYERNAMGWMIPTEITGAMSAVLHPISENVAFVVETDSRGEFFLFENRQKTGWDTYIPNHGMLIWHIHYNSMVWANNMVNDNASHQYVDIEEADGIGDRKTQEGDVFPGTDGITSFTGTGFPQFRTWSDQIIDLPLTEISEKDGLITFNVKGGGETVELKGENCTGEHGDGGNENEGDENGDSGIDATLNDIGAAPTEYYTLQGMRIANPQSGIFIEKRGNEYRKIRISK